MEAQNELKKFKESVSKLLYLMKWVPFKTEITGFSFLDS